MKRFATFLMAVLAACGGDTKEVTAKREDPSLIVLVSLDTLRAEHVSAYGYHRPTTPNLDALADDGVLYERAVAQATNTLISHKSMLTGKLPLRLVHEQTNATREQLTHLAEDPTRVISGSLAAVEPTLAASMKADGYATAGFADGSWMRSALKFHLGFDTYMGEQKVGLKTNGPRALDWVRGLSGAKGFLFLHTYDAHCPYTPPEPYNSLFCKSHAQHPSFDARCPKRTGPPGFEELNLSDADLQAITDHYDGGIVYTDAMFGEFVDGLKDAGRYEEALIIVTSDHGEGLGDNGQIGHGGLFAEQVFVPLMVKFPKSWEIEPTRVPSTVELTDIVPTLLEATGQPKAEGLDGRSLIAPALGERLYRVGVAQIAYNEFQGNATWQSNPVKRAVYDPDGFWLLLDEKANSKKLFAMEGLRTSAATSNEDLSDTLESFIRVRENFGGGDAFRLPSDFRMDPELRKQLTALGYL